MNTKIPQLKRQIKLILLFFITALVLSGATAIPVHSEIGFLLTRMQAGTFVYDWLQRVFTALLATQAAYPFLLYGYDWLAFAHFVIAIAFIGPMRNPVKNIWVLEFGMIACAVVIPYAFAFCAFRGIPAWWALIDSCFGVFGFIPLWICRRKTLELESLIEKEKLNLVF